MTTALDEFDLDVRLGPADPESELPGAQQSLLSVGAHCRTNDPFCGTTISILSGKERR